MSSSCPGRPGHAHSSVLRVYTVTL
jgi:hypothetical protein